MFSIHIDDSILFSQKRSNMLGKRAWRGVIDTLFYALIFSFIFETILCETL